VPRQCLKTTSIGRSPRPTSRCPFNPNFALAYSNLGSIHVYSGEPLAGITAIERAMRMDPAWSQQYLHFPPAPNSALIDEFSGTAAYKVHRSVGQENCDRQVWLEAV
jgi:hypothetical protein